MIAGCDWSSGALLVLLACLVLVYKRGHKRTSSPHRPAAPSNLKPLPRPPSLPLIGHLHLMRDYQHNPWEGFEAIRREYGDIVSLKMGVHQMVLISSVAHMKEVLIRKGDVFADRPSFPRHDIVFGGDKEHSLALCNWSNTHRARRKFCKRGVVPNKLSARNQLLEKIISHSMSDFLADIADNDARKSKQQASRDEQHAPSNLNHHHSDHLNPNLNLNHISSNNNNNNNNNNNIRDVGGLKPSINQRPGDELLNAPSYCVDKNDLLFLTGDIFMKFLCNETRPHEDKAYENFNIGSDFIFYDINQCYLTDFMPYLTSVGFAYSYLKQVRAVTDYCRFYIDDNIFEPRLAHHLAAKQRRQQQHKLASSTATKINDELETRTPADPLASVADSDYQNKVNICGDDDDEDEGDQNNDDYLDSIIRDYIKGGSSMALDDYKVGFADLLAGHAAVTNILMRLMGHLALDAQMQEMICEEARRTKLTSLDHMPPLPVTEAALQEALRLASSPIVPHVAREDSSIGDYFVPKGSAVLFNCYNVNLSPDLWNEPRSYKPTRFLKSSQNSSGEVSYKLELPKYFMPFSVGPRQCLGYKMVESISVAAAAYLCSKYVIKANDEQLVERLLEPKGSVALNPLQECFELQLLPR